MLEGCSSKSWYSPLHFVNVCKEPCLHGACSAFVLNKRMQAVYSWSGERSDFRSPRWTIQLYYPSSSLFGIRHKQMSRISIALLARVNGRYRITILFDYEYLQVNHMAPVHHLFLVCILRASVFSCIWEADLRSFALTLTQLCATEEWNPRACNMSVFQALSIHEACVLKQQQRRLVMDH